MEEAASYPMYTLSIFAKTLVSVAVAVWVCISGGSTPLIYMSAFLLVLSPFCHCGFVVQPAVRDHDNVNAVLFLRLFYSFYFLVYRVFCTFA